MKTKQLFSLFFAAVMCVALLVVIIVLNNRLAGNTPKNGKEDGDTVKVENVDAGTEAETQKKEEEKEEEPEPEPEPVLHNVTFLAAGDNIVHTNVYYDAELNAKAAGTGESYIFDPMYDNIRELVSSRDIAYINQEGPIAGSEFGYSGYPTFNAPNEMGDAIVNTGFDIVSIANNHMLDKGAKGYENSINFWKSKPVTLIGGYESEEDFNTIRYYDYNGLRIALLSYTYGTNGIYLPASSTLWVPYYDEETVDRHCKEARANADLVFVSIHWGYEDHFKPNEEQEKYCDLLVNNNVDVIIGHHPHVLQPMEWRDRPDGKKTLVAYSIGNLLSTMLYSRNMVGGLLTFDIQYYDENTKDAVIANPKLIPTVCYYNKNRRKLKIYKFSEFTPELLATHGSNLSEASNFEQMKGYVTNTIDREFLSDDFLSLIDGNAA